MGIETINAYATCFIAFASIMQALATIALVVVTTKYVKKTGELLTETKGEHERQTLKTFVFHLIKNNHIFESWEKQKIFIKSEANLEDDKLAVIVAELQYENKITQAANGVWTLKLPESQTRLRTF